MKHRSSLRTTLFRLALLPVLVVGLVVPASAAPAVAPPAAPSTCGADAASATCDVTIDARDFPTGGPLSDFTFIVNLDNSKLPDDPLALNYESHSPLMAIGDASDPTVTLPDGRYLVSTRSLGHKMWGAYFTLPDDAADNGNLTVRVDLTVTDEVHPLPLGRLTTYVFADNRWTNGAPDAEESSNICGGDGDQDNCGGIVMAGFRITLDEETDNAVTVDYFNQPLCSDGPTPGVCLSDADGFNTIDNLGPASYFIHVTPPESPTHPDPNNPSGPPLAGCNSNPDSRWYQTTTIDGGLTLLAPVEEGSDGSGAPGEQLWEPIAGGNRTGYFFGFACAPLDFETPGTGEITGTARNWVEWAPYSFGTVNEPVEFPFIALTDAATDSTLYVGQGDAAGNFDIQGVPAGTYVISVWDEQLTYIMRFKPVTVGENEIVDANETGDDGSLGVGVSRWFGWLDGTVYKDMNGNGQYDPGTDTTLGNTDVDQRWRDGSIKAGTFTDPDGYYVYPTAEGGALGKWIINEQGFARFSAFPGASVYDEHTGAVTPSCVTDGPLPADPCIPNSEGGGLLMNQLVLEGHRATVDWGKRDYPAGTPGQIVGVTYWATTRNEFNAALQAHEDYEPGIPDITVLLEDLNGLVLNKYVTDHWGQPSYLQDPLDPSNSFTQNCDPIRDFSGVPIIGVFNPNIGPECLEVPLTGIQTKEGKFDGGYAFASYCPDGYDLVADDGTCLGLNPDQVDLVAGDYVVHAVMPTDPNDARYCNPASTDGGLKSLSGPFSDEADAQTGCLYRIVKEEDVNVDLGNQFAPQIPPPPCIGDDHVLDQSTLVTRSPLYTGNQLTSPSAPLCDKKLIVLQNGQNANADFNMMTNFRTDPNGDGSSSLTGDVHIPGRFVGQTFNDIYFETNPISPWYGEPRPIGGIPVGIYARVDTVCPADDPFCATPNANLPFTPDNWRLLTTVTTSPDGSFEALVPSFETFNCPIPQGPCPGMYMITVDDPGRIESANPNYNPNLLTATTPASAWPGLTNETLDLPLDPISGTTCDFSIGPDNLASTVPELLQVQKRQADNVTLRPASEQGPFVRESDTGTDRRITILADFIGPAGPTGPTGGHVNLTDAATGAVTTLTQANLGIVSWTDATLTPDPADVDTIVIQVPDVSTSFTPGPKQLTIVGANSNGVFGSSSINGITLHVLYASSTVPGSSHIDNATTRTSTFVTDSAVVAGDLGRFVTASPAAGFLLGRTITSVSPGVGFTINFPATATGTRTLTITKVDTVGVTTGSNVATDPSVVAGDLGRSVTFLPSGQGLGGTRTITAVTSGVSFTFSGTPKTAGGSATRLATITKTDAGAFITTGTLVLDSSITAADVGKPVSGAGVPLGTTIVSVTAGASFVMSNPATGTSYPLTVPLTIGTPIAVTPYSPTVVNVPAPPPAGGDPHALQNAINAASAGSLLVLSPGTYNENVLVWKPLKIQGVGPGGIVGAHELQNRAPEDPRFSVKGSVIDGRFFQQNATAYDATVAAHAPYAVDPFYFTILRGADITVVAQSTSAYGSDSTATPTDMLASTTARIDGVGLQHGNGDGAGGIQLQAYINNMQLTNNILENNGGLFAGGIGLGQPYAHQNTNHKVRMANDRIMGNGGIVRSGGIGIFYGSDNYEVASSILCSNYGVEYGSGISHWGLSPNSSIHDNLIYFNESFDSGAGLSLQSEVPIGGDCTIATGTVASCLGDGSGAVNIDRNLFYGNYSGDDGGAIFVANALDQPINIRNNMIVLNGAADLGGGIMLDDASNVSIINNTIAANVTTASGESSCATNPACAHGAGLTSEANEPLFAPGFSNPVALFNNIFWENEAFILDTFGPGAILVSQGFIDFEVFGGALPAASTFTPRFSDLTNGLILAPNGAQVPLPGGAVGAAPNAQGNISADPLFVDPSNLTQLGLTVTGSRGDPQQASVTITGGDPVEGLSGGDFAGDFHIQFLVSPAIDRGVRCSAMPIPVPANAVTATCASTSRGIEAPNGVPSAANPSGGDYDRQYRPQLLSLRVRTPWDMGADEVPGIPVGGFPTAGFSLAAMLDNFNRNTPVTAGGVILGGNWVGAATQPGSNPHDYLPYSIVDNQALVRNTSGFGPVVWWYTGDTDNTFFGPRQEAHFRFTDVSATATEQGLILKGNGFDSGFTLGSDTTLIDVVYNKANHKIIVKTFCGSNVPGCKSQGWVTRATFTDINFVNGDSFGAQALNDGTVVVYRNGAAIGTANLLGSKPWPGASGGGRIGVWFKGTSNTASSDARFDDFGGGTLP